MKNLNIEFDEEELLSRVIEYLSLEMGKPGRAIVKAINSIICNEINMKMQGHLVREARCFNEGSCFSERNDLKWLSSNGIYVYNNEIRFSLIKNIVINDVIVFKNNFLYIEPMIDSVMDRLNGVRRRAIEIGVSSAFFRDPVLDDARENNVEFLKIKEYKNHINYRYLFYKIYIKGDFFNKVSERLILNNVSYRIPRYWHSSLVCSYDNIINGDTVFCSCCEKVFKSERNLDLIRGDLIRGDVSEAIDAVTFGRYVDDVCHICLQKKIGSKEVFIKYGVLEDVEKWFFAKLESEKYGININTAKKRVLSLFGVGRWKREDELYRIACELFGVESVLREASPRWLSPLRLDVFVPRLSLAIEHQGQQHYEPVKAFGGEEGHERVKERDALKKKLCSENGVHLVEIRYDAALTEDSIRNRLKKYI